MLAVLVIGITAGTALAANGNCPNGLPFCFVANNPANATEVNHNFMQLKEWLETKVGVVSAAGVTASRVAASGAVTGATLASSNVTVSDRIVGANAAGNLHVDSSGTGTYLNWFGGNAVIFGTGTQSEVARIDNRGLVVAGHRAPSVIVSTNCAAGSCLASCPAGTTIKLAFGLHGLAANAQSGNWSCGGGFQWKGDCVGGTSCTTTTACGSSGTFLECW